MVDKADTEGNVSIQLSGDHVLSQSFAIDSLKGLIKHIYIMRPESSIPDARVDEYIKPYVILKHKVQALIVYNW